jgi:hypothetical protein
MFTYLNIGPDTSHVYHSITKTHLYSIFFFKSSSGPRARHITRVSQYHQNTFLLHFFQKSLSEPWARHVRLYHMCITYVSQYYQNTFLLYFSQKSSSGPRACHVTRVSHVYHSITKTHFYSIFFKNHHWDPGSATSDCITVLPKHISTPFFSKKSSSEPHARHVTRVS